MNEFGEKRIMQRPVKHGSFWKGDYNLIREIKFQKTVKEKW